MDNLTQKKKRNSNEEWEKIDKSAREIKGDGERSFDEKPKNRRKNFGAQLHKMSHMDKQIEN